MWNFHSFFFFCVIHVYLHGLIFFCSGNEYNIFSFLDPFYRHLFEERYFDFLLQTEDQVYFYLCTYRNKPPPLKMTIECLLFGSISAPASNCSQLKKKI